MIVVPDNEFRDAKNPWKISPSFIVTTAGSPMGSDSVANSNHYLDSVERVVPPESLENFTVFGIDNCSTAKKDGRLTMEGAQERAVSHGHGGKTMIHDVKIRGFTIGDFFTAINYPSSISARRPAACRRKEAMQPMSRYFIAR